MDEQVVTVTLPTDTAVLVTREFAAAPHQVYRALTEPGAVRRWWGAGSGVVTAEIDLRVGGRWRYVLVGDGYEVGLHGVYREIVPGARVACTEVDEGRPDGEASAALCTYTVRDVGGRSVLHLFTAVRTREDRDALLDSGVEEGVAASWELLDRVALSLR